MLDKKFIDLVNSEFEKVKQNLGDRKENLLRVFDKANEKEAFCLKYLYAFMPLSDLANYDGELFLTHIKQSLKTMEVVPWGKKIGAEMFLNYILSYRINNENIEDYRTPFFEELYPRVKDLSMLDAVYEVNYWCFEKATYKSTDNRTASPLTVIRNTYARCGEESTLATAALRSVGIPARQCYTPRWAHCDDNHAWVEAWIDGEWHYLGACEPTPVLDTGWFTSSALRAMLVHSRVFSAVVSDDIFTFQTDKMTEVNILSRYTEIKEITVKVNNNGAPLKNANVRYELLNYCEMFPIANLKTNENGISSLVTGLGDLFIFVTDGEKFAYKKVNVKDVDLVEFDLAKEGLTCQECEIEFDMVSPVQKAFDENKATEEQQKNHEIKNENAQKIRKDFEATFYTEQSGKEFAKKYGKFKTEIGTILFNAKGNYPEIIKFLDTENNKIDLEYKILLLNSLRSKDLSDITFEILTKHVNNAMKYKNNFDKDIFVDNILCPRIGNEMITNYRGFINSYFNDSQKQEFINNPSKVYDYINTNIKDAGTKDYSTLSSSPTGLLELKQGSLISRKTLFVAICRSLGIPARIQITDGSLEYFKDNAWVCVDKDVKQDVEALKTATLTLQKDNDSEFEYYKNFTVAILKNGYYQTLNFENSKWENNSITYKVEAGEYRILTSNRQTNGDQLVKAYCFSIKDKQNITKQIEIRKDLLEQQLKSVDVRDYSVKTIDDKDTMMSKVLSNSNIVSWLEEGKEPTEHLLNEMLDLQEKYRETDSNIIFIINSLDALKNHTLDKTLKAIPNIKVFVNDDDKIVDDVFEKFEIIDKKLPLITIIENGKGIFASSGYNVNIADMLLKIINRNK